MAMQLSTTVRNAKNDAVETTISTSPILRIRTGAAPATPATADSGTVLATMTLPSDWLAASSGGVKSLLGTWQDAAADATGTAGHYRIYDSGGTVCHIQGTCGQSVTLSTSALTAANGNVLTFTSTTGVVVGQTVTGTGVPSDTFVSALTSTTVTLSRTSTAGVSSGASIVFGYDLTVDNASIVTGQQVTVTAWSMTDGNP